MIFTEASDVNDYQNCFAKTDILLILLSLITAIRFMIEVHIRTIYSGPLRENPTRPVAHSSIRFMLGIQAEPWPT